MVDDAGASPAARALAERFGARYEPHPAPARPERRAQHRRRALQRRARGVRRRRRPRRARAGSRRCSTRRASIPQVDVFTGPIAPASRAARRARCGREGPPITTLDLGAAGHRRALRVGRQHGDPPQRAGARRPVRRLARARRRRAGVAGPPAARSTPGARVLYVAGAAVEHRRAGADARLRSLARGAYARGRAARRFDARRGAGAVAARASCSRSPAALGHVVRRRCPAGLTMVAHSAGRLREGLRERSRDAPRPARAERASRRAGRLPLRRERHRRRPRRACAAARPTRRSNAWELVERPAPAPGARRAPRAAARAGARARRRAPRAPRAGARRSRAELLRSRHDVELHTCAAARARQVREPQPPARRAPGRRPRLAAGGRRRRRAAARLPRPLPVPVRALLAAARPARPPPALARGLAASRGAARGSVVRETRFVEIGPVTAFARAHVPDAAAVPASCAWAGAWTRTGRRSRASTAGAAA